MGRTGRGLLAAVVVALVILLTACLTEPTPVPPGPTDEERREWLDDADQEWWDAVVAPHSDLERPAVDVVRTVQPAEWASEIEACLTRAGVERVSVSGTGASYSMSYWGEPDPEFRSTFYVCMRQYPSEQVGEHSSFFSRAQLGFLYDHWAMKTVPCLRLAGFDTPDAPSRDSFVDEYYTENQWDPYLHLRERQDIDWELVNFRCPPPPVEPFGELQAG